MLATKANSYSTFVCVKFALNKNCRAVSLETLVALALFPATLASSELTSPVKLISLGSKPPLLTPIARIGLGATAVLVRLPQTPTWRKLPADLVILCAISSIHLPLP